MYTRCFERGSEAGINMGYTYEVINISPYGFEWYVNNELVRTGLVEDIDADIESLIDIGFEEVL